MRKWFVVLAVVFGLFVVVFRAHAFNTKWSGAVEDISRSSIRTSSAAVTTGRGFFYGVILSTDGTNNVTITVYDGSSASGSKVTPTMVVDGAGGASGWALSLDPAITYTTGLYVSVSVAGGGTCEYQVLYYTLP